MPRGDDVAGRGPDNPPCHGESLNDVIRAGLIPIRWAFEACLQVRGLTFFQRPIAARAAQAPTRCPPVREARSAARAAFAPQAPCTPPPGCAEEEAR